MTTNLSRREALRLGGGTLLGATFIGGISACGSDSSSTGTESGSATIRIMFRGSNDRNQKIVEALTGIESRASGLTITSDYGEGQSWAAKLNTQLSSGNGPDIFITEILGLGNYVKEGAARDITEFVPDPINTENWDEQVVKGGQVNGKQYGISTGSNAYGLFYNPDALAKAGVTAMDPAWTWDDYAAIAREVSTANGQAPYGGEDGSSNAQTFQAYVRSWGHELFTTEGQLGIDKDALVDFWSYWERLRADGATVPPDVQAQGIANFTQNVLAQGKGAMLFDYSNRIGSVESLAGQKLQITTYPEGDRSGLFIRPTLIWAVYSRSDNPERAAEVVNALVNDPEPAQIIKTDLGVPNNPDHIEALEGSATPEDQRQFDYLTLVAERQTPLDQVVWPAGGANILGTFQSIGEQVSFGQLGIDEAAGQFLTEAENILSA